jgi:hypothetical protein
MGNENAPAERPYEEILFEGEMVELEKMHADRQAEDFTETFISGNQTVTVTHSVESPSRYEFAVPNRDLAEHTLFSHIVFSVNFFDERVVEIPHALLSVYRRINAAKNAGNVALAWAKIHRASPLGLPDKAERSRFESIFRDYVADREPQDGQA